MYLEAYSRGAASKEGPDVNGNRATIVQIDDPLEFWKNQQVLS